MIVDVYYGLSDVWLCDRAVCEDLYENTFGGTWQTVLMFERKVVDQRHLLQEGFLVYTPNTDFIHLDSIPFVPSLH